MLEVDLWGVAGAQGILAVLIMAAATYALRFGGLMLAARLPKDGRWAAALQSLPGMVLLALVAPAVVHLGWLGAVAGGATAVAAARGANLLVAMLVGVGLVGGARALGLA